MAISSKTLGISAVAVVIVGVGGYLGAQAVVGNEVEKSLTQAFERLDASPTWRVTDVHIDKSLFETTATATLHLVGYDEASGDIDLLVDHGVFQSPVTGSIVPNQALFSGVVDIDMVASLSGVSGQLKTDRLDIMEGQGEINDWTLDLSFEDERHWNVDAVTDDFTFTDPVEDVTYRFFSTRVQMDTQGDEGHNVEQRIDVPRIEVLAQGVTFYLEDTELEVVTQPAGDTGLVNQSGHINIGDMGMDDTSFGSLAMNLGGTRLDMNALQDFQEAYMPLERMQQVREEQPEAVNDKRYREHLIGSIESAHVLLSNSPTFEIDPLQAHIVVPDMGLDFKPRLSLEMRFDGENLAKQTLYGAFWESGLTPPPALENANPSAASSLEDLMGRTFVSLAITTPPEEVMMLVPMPFSFMLDPALEQQTLTFKQGRLSLNGEELM